MNAGSKYRQRLKNAIQPVEQQSSWQQLLMNYHVKRLWIGTQMTHLPENGRMFLGTAPHEASCHTDSTAVVGLLLGTSSSGAGRHICRTRFTCFHGEEFCAKSNENRFKNKNRERRLAWFISLPSTTQAIVSSPTKSSVKANWKCTEKN